ncbi:DUF3772 domain-containing protein [Sphingomonas sp. 22L2VL55-3]
MTLLRYLAALLLLATALPGIAQDEPKVATVGASLTQASAELQAIDDATPAARDDKARQALRTRAQTVQTTAADAVRTLTLEMALVQARVAELGAATPGVVEAPEIRQQRKLLAQSQSAIDSAIKRARLIGIEAKQQIDDIGAAEAEELGQQLSENTGSPLSPTLWAAIVDHLPRDTARMMRFANVEIRQFGARFDMRAGTGLLIGIPTALVLIVPLRRWLHGVGRRYATNHAPGGRLRRSAYALWLVVIGTALPGLAAWAIVALAALGRAGIARLEPVRRALRRDHMVLRVRVVARRCAPAARPVHMAAAADRRPGRAGAAPVHLDGRRADLFRPAADRDEHADRHQRAGIERGQRGRCVAPHRPARRDPGDARPVARRRAARPGQSPRATRCSRSSRHWSGWSCS